MAHMSFIPTDVRFLALIAGVVIAQSLWWIFQRALFRLGMPKGVVMSASGLGTLGLLVASLVRFGPPALTPQLVFLFLVQTVLSAIIAYCFVSAVEHSEASYAVSVTALTPILVIWTGSLILGELPGRVSIVGMFVILFGTYLLHLVSNGQTRRLGDPLREMWRKRGIWLWYALGAAGASALNFPLEKRAVQLSNFLLAPAVHLFFGWALVWGILSIVRGEYAGVRNLAPRWRVLLPLLAGLVLSFAITNAFQGAAYRFGYAASVAALKRLDGPVTVLLATAFLGERNVRSRFLGMAVIALGAVLIAIGR